MNANVQTFNQEIKDHATRLRLPGLIVAVVQDGKIIYQQTEGYADLERKMPLGPDSIFWIASLTKTFAAVLMMQYAQEGKLSTEDLVTQYPFASVGFFPQRIGPTLKLKHVLSHTSEGVPGNQFVYHGGRYNFLAGAIQAMNGKSDTLEAFRDELTTRIFRPLGLNSTLFGYPKDPDPALKSRIITPYRYDTTKQAFTVNNAVYGLNVAFPAAGLLSSIADLATYTHALDSHRLLPEASYRKMTTPFVTNNGKPAPYGQGWFTQRFADTTLHWVYGLEDSGSALLLRVPDRKLTLIALSTCDLISTPFRLGSGNVLRSPFAVSFLKHFVFPDALNGVAIPYDSDREAIRKAFAAKNRHPIYPEELFTQALLRIFAAKTFRQPDPKAEQLTELLYTLDAKAFERNDPALIHLLAEIGGTALTGAADRFIRHYESTRLFNPHMTRKPGALYDDATFAERTPVSRFSSFSSWVMSPSL